ncbi:MAG: galactose oxidase [Trueperaceae bacterium]|nr:galactose oxidase [Trueperaceae bacterium]
MPHPFRAFGAATLALIATVSTISFALGDTGWTSLPDLAVARQEVAAVWLDGALYVVGGFGTGRETLSSAERWREGASEWERLPDMPVAVNHPAAVAIAGRLVVVGGFGGPGLQNPVDATQVYDPATDAWSLAASLPTVRGALAAAVVDDLVIAVGGARGGVSVAEVAAYDPVADAWTAWPDMPSARDHHAVAAVDGHLHAIGGRAAGDFTMATHEVYDLAAARWIEAPPMPTGRSGHAVAALDGCLYALGGEGNQARTDGMFDQVERFVRATGEWEQLPAMPVPRHGMGAVAVGGRLLVPAGATVAGFGAVAVADAFKPTPCAR